jgi:transposase
MKNDSVRDQELLLKVIQEQQATIEKLSHRIEQLLHLLYGTKNEKRKPKPNEDASSKPKPRLPASSTGEEPKTPGRKPLPADLPRVKVVHELPPEQQVCECGCTLKRMGQLVTEQLDLKPAELFVKQHVRYKYVCGGCQSMTTTPLPPQPIDKGLAGPGLLAEVIVNKYQDALPLYRQEQRFKRHGIDFNRSTLCEWIMQCAFLCEPIVALMKEDALLRGHRLFSDDTPVPVLAKGKTHTGRLWVYVGGGTDQPNCTVYEYTPTRSQTGPQRFLKGYRGYLQADAYAGYDVLYKNGDIIEVACWAHSRRKFFEITLSAKKEGLADEALDFIAKLYDIERRAKSLNPEQRRYCRRRHSKPLLKQFKRWLNRHHKTVLPKTPIGKAIQYTLNHWRALNNYLRHGILNIDNNTAERAIKTVVIGRRNWLFAGSHEGAKKAAILYSLIETCKLNKINPYEYFKDILARLPTTTSKDLPFLLPYYWQPLKEVA